MSKTHDGWDEWDQERDLPALERVVTVLYEAAKPTDARIVARAWKALGGKAEAPDDGVTTVFSI